MKLYNTPAKDKEQINPLSDKQITIYTCGPTVYDYPHIGNWFTFIRYDLLIRTLSLNKLNPVWVMNITDVGHLVSDADDGEDKLEKGAKREGKTAWDVAKFYENNFRLGLQKLNIIQPTFLPRATDHIADQIELISTLEIKGFTYLIDDGVYFDTSRFPSYANFAQLDLEDLKSGARVDFNPQKRNASDFALWKLSSPNQKRDMEWSSPWGIGFPGWHLECSAMAMKYLGNTIDIHAGGIDHIPVHHTNEIAQSEAATGEKFSKYWMHANHITVNGERIGKSLGNGITLEQIEETGYSMQAVRLNALESHYRTQSKFSWESLQAASNRLAGYTAMAQQSWQATENGLVNKSDIDNISQKILTLLNDDLNTPEVLAVLSSLENEVINNGLNLLAVESFSTFLAWIDKALGLKLSLQEDITNSQKLIINERNKARSRNDWARSDALRDKLLSEGVEVKDTTRGTIWTRVTNT